MERTEIEDRLRSVIEDTSKDIDWATDKFEENREEVEEIVFEGATEDMVDKEAIKMVRGDVHKTIREERRSPERLQFIVIGHRGIQEWSDGTVGKKDVLVGFGVVKPENEAPGIGVFICDATTGVSVHELQTEFSDVCQPKTGTFRLSESDHETANGTPIYVCNTVAGALPEIETQDDFNEEKPVSILREFVPEANIDTIHESLSKTNNDGYPVAFGGDMRRMECMVVDWYDGDGFNTYTVLDNTIARPEELSDDIVADQARTPGLTAWCPDDFFEYGCDSVLELYGTITRSNDGQVTMNVYSAYPLTEFEQGENKMPPQTDNSPSGPEDTIQVCHVDEEQFDEYGGRSYRNGKNRHLGNTEVGNTGWLGNPFTTDTLPRQQAIELYERAFQYRMIHDDEFRKEVVALRGKQVACHCRHSDDDSPACHLDVVRDFLSETA